MQPSPPLQVGSSSSPSAKEEEELFIFSPDEQVELPSGNDLVVLEALSDSFFEQAGAVSFQGIKRKLGLHQETLSRALRRLERDGFVDKTDHDYKLSKKGNMILSRKNKLKHSPSREVLLPIPILRTLLPQDVTESDLEEVLAHKWFGALRWYGSSHTEVGVVLAWTTDDGKLRLSVRIAGGDLVVETFATTKESMESAIRAAYEIFDHISRAFKRTSGILPSPSSTRASLYRPA